VTDELQSIVTERSQKRARLDRAIEEFFDSPSAVGSFERAMRGMAYWLLSYPDGADLLEQELNQRPVSSDPGYLRRRLALRRLVIVLRGLA
jgi:hypothetical protein